MRTFGEEVLTDHPESAEIELLVFQRGVKVEILFQALLHRTTSSLRSSRLKAAKKQICRIAGRSELQRMNFGEVSTDQKCPPPPVFCIFFSQRRLLIGEPNFTILQTV